METVQVYHVKVIEHPEGLQDSVLSFLGRSVKERH